MFQSSFELTGYITLNTFLEGINKIPVSKLFRAYGLYNGIKGTDQLFPDAVSKLFRAYGLYNSFIDHCIEIEESSFKALSSLRVI